MTKPRWQTQPVGLQGRALEIWSHYASGLGRSGLLTAENAESFRFLCQLLALCEAAAGDIERSGVVLGTGPAEKKSNPAVAALLAAQKAATPLLRKFGLQ